MKYLERMGRRGSRPFHTVISTTFAIEFGAFEELVLPHLIASGASNLLLVSDERMASLYCPTALNFRCSWAVTTSCFRLRSRRGCFTQRLSFRSAGARAGCSSVPPILPPGAWQGTPKRAGLQHGHGLILDLVDRAGLRLDPELRHALQTLMPPESTDCMLVEEVFQHGAVAEENDLQPTWG